MAQCLGVVAAICCSSWTTRFATQRFGTSSCNLVQPLQTTRRQTTSAGGIPRPWSWCFLFTVSDLHLTSRLLLIPIYSSDTPFNIDRLCGLEISGTLVYFIVTRPSKTRQALRLQVAPGLPNVAQPPALRFTLSADKTTAGPFNQEPTTFLVSDFMQPNHMPFRARSTSLPVPCGVTFRDWRALASTSPLQNILDGVY